MLLEPESTGSIYYLPLQYYSVPEAIGGNYVTPLATGGLRANIQLIVVLNFKIV